MSTATDLTQEPAPVDSELTATDPPDNGAPNPGPPRIFDRHFSPVGLIIAGLYFASSLLPSLLPRQSLLQGVLSGATMAIGYAVGASLEATWRWLGIPVLRGRAKAIVIPIILALVTLTIAAAIWQYVGWQDAQRQAFGMPGISITGWATIAVVTVFVAALLLVLARLTRKLARGIIGWLNRFLPPRFAVALGILLLSLLVLGIYSNVLVTGFWAGANAVFAPRDSINKAGVTGPPTTSARSGGPGSPVTWDSLGREGRSFVSTGPTKDDLQKADPTVKAKEPIRVFAGLASADTVQGRADLVLDELIRTKAFDREILLLATSTGSGFVDPAGIDPFEYLWHGDTAIASMQYSYLPSWLSLLADGDNVQASANTLYRTVNDYLKTLPEDERPLLYMYGLSLGSFGVQSVLTSIEMLNEPVDGVLMTGPPFINQLHKDLTANRDAGSPVWQPVYQDGRTVRFSANPVVLDEPEGPWGPVRVAYLQHDTDPVVWFSPSLALREPEWLTEGQRGPNLSPEFEWRAIVTMWQTGFDLASAGGVPWGYGHLYKPSENTLGWAAVSRPPGWTAAEIDTLAEQMDQRLLGE